MEEAKNGVRGEGPSLREARTKNIVVINFSARFSQQKDEGGKRRIAFRGKHRCFDTS